MKIRFSKVTRFATLAALVALCTLAAGCGGNRGGARFFEYDSAVDDVNGKINLDRITFITPRIKAGLVEGRLSRDYIDQVVGKISEGDYTSFRISAYIIFDEYRVTLYKSELFEKTANPADKKDVKKIRAGLLEALALYESI